MEARFGGSSSNKLVGATKSVDEVSFLSISIPMEVEKKRRIDLLCAGQ
jgi:hypothetical protein